MEILDTSTDLKTCPNITSQLNFLEQISSPHSFPPTVLPKSSNSEGTSMAKSTSKTCTQGVDIFTNLLPRKRFRKRVKNHERPFMPSKGTLSNGSRYAIFMSCCEKKKKKTAWLPNAEKNCEENVENLETFEPGACTQQALSFVNKLQNLDAFVKH